MAYTYGAITLNNGTMFRARLIEETGKVEYMNHQGAKTASKTLAKTFKKGYDSVVNPTNRYRFPDEYDNPHASHVSSKDAEWSQHPKQ